MNENIDTGNDDDLETFERDFFQVPSAKEPEPDPVDVDPIEDTKTDDEPVEPLATDENADDNEPEDKPKGKKPKSSVQERFDEITAARREAERERDELRRRLEALEAAANTPNKEPETKATTVAKTEGEPTVDDVDTEGNLKYPLGEFDPNFVRALARFTAKQETEALKAQQAEEVARRQAEEVRTAQIAQWQEKVKAVEETIPDIREAGVVLDDAFQHVDPEYGEYLANTIMSLDHGPEVLYYLANNLDEARTIANASPVQAAIKLGQLEGLLASQKTKPVTKKVTEAPTPPISRVRGTTGRVDVADDTDDLDAFEQKFFSGRRRL